MAIEPTRMGTLWISKEVLQKEKWLIDQAISASMIQMKKYKGLHGFLKPSVIRLGDFSLVLCDYKLTPAVATFIGIPGRSRAPIVQELFIMD